MEYSEKMFDFRDGINCEIKKDVPMKMYSSFKTGGNASLMLSPKDEKSLFEAVKKCKENNIRPFILGNGSNILVSDGGIDNVVIHIGKGFDEISLIDDTTIRCYAGCSLMRLCRFALENSLSGLEFAYGIPGSVGGAIYMNAGAYGGEMKDVVVSCDYITFDGDKGTYTKDEMQLSYRNSIFNNSDKIIVSVILKLEKGSKTEIENKMNELMGKRKSKQPLEYPSAGSTFKRPEGHFAGQLIEECGLRGKTIGGAQVSEKHCGFIINKNNASSDDIKDLIEFVRDEVLEQKGVYLETEVKFI
ncbi:MAG: UDP-N-acetylmuramate dehydrogenase [Clostridia bacterium]|nr:UDP-N-acetylmuramate dehydrogenase [Clostridia bacterium]